VKAFSLPVAFTTYRVEFSRKKPRVGKDDCQGYCDFKNRKIVIWENPNQESMRACLWHEYHHALFYELGHDELAGEEGIVESMALSIMRVRLEIPDL
jgi:uncharacterized protein YjaZ